MTTEKDIKMCSLSSALVNLTFVTVRRAALSYPRVTAGAPSQHTGPLNEKNYQLSPALLKTHLHPVRFHYGRGPAQELQDRTEPECTDRAGQAPIRLTRLTGPIDS